MAKEISNKAYQWGHFAVIIVEIIVYAIFIYLAYRIKNSPYVLREIRLTGNQGTLSKQDASLRRIKLFSTIIIWISVVMIILTALATIPISKKYEGGIVINQ